MRGSYRSVAAAACTLACGTILATPGLAQEDTAGCHAPSGEQIRGWDGVWLSEGLRSDLAGRSSIDTGQPLQPPLLMMPGAQLTDAGMTALETMIYRLVRGVSFGAGWGFPMMMQSPAPLKFVISPTETVITSQYREIRYIPTDGAPLPSPEDLWPTMWGTSRGCWEGDTLVIETVSVQRDLLSAGMSPPLSEEARYVERLRLVSSDRIEGTMTITDSAMIEQPYTINLVWVRHPVLTRLIHEGDTLENDRLVVVNGMPTIADPRGEQEAEEPQFPPVIPLTDAEMDRYTGSFQIEGTPFIMNLERQRGRLVAQVLPPQPMFLPIYPDGEHSFHSRSLGNRLLFEMGDDGRATGLTGADPQGVPIVARRIGPQAELLPRVEPKDE